MPALFFARLACASRLFFSVALLLGSFTFLSTSVGGGKMSEDLPVLSPAGNAQAQANGVPAVEGWITEEATGKAVVGATVRVENLSTVSGAEGHFSFSAAQLGLSGGKTRSAFTPLRVEVEATHFAPWLLESVKYYDSDTLRLYPRLVNEKESAGQSRNPVFSYVVGRAKDRTTNREGIDQHFASNLALNVSTTALTPPATIRVYRTATGIVEVVPFREYVKYVLPNEWVPSWSPEALKAGAMAVKSYGWYWVSRGGKQVALGADVKDNVDDQVYDPNVSYASTDAAVDTTFNYAITRNGDLFQAQYCAGNYRADPAGDCPWPSQYMTQWGSSYHADQGRTWGWILGFYYGGSVITPRPPGGGYTGPPPTSPPVATRQAMPQAPPSGAFAIGQGSARADVFQAAYNRNGGAGVLGMPTGPVRWWMQYVSEFNVVAQPFSGSDGRSNIWLVFDVLKANDETGYRAYLLSGGIASAYEDHLPPGPEWIGAPTSDPYAADLTKPAFRSQGFTKGTLLESSAGVQFVSWQEQFSGWKAEYFVGHQPPSARLTPPVALPGQPAAVRELKALKLAWATTANIPQSLGAGSADWSAQFTKVVELDAGVYDFTVRAGSGVRLWVDGVLGVNGWNWDSLRSETYSPLLTTGKHTIRVQYYSLDPAANLELNYAKRGSVALPPPSAPLIPVAKPGLSAVRVQVQWLGRPAAPSDSWVQPLALHLSTPSDPAVLATYRGMTDRNGVAFFQGLPSGIFNMHVKGAHSLQTARAGVTLSDNATTELDMKAQVEGDTDGDNCVTVTDFAFVQSMLGTHIDIPGFNPTADLNGDGFVTMTDVSLLRSGFDMCGDVSADNEFQPLALTVAPSLSKKLSPWLNPERLQKGLGMSLVASTSQPRSGDVIEVRVQAITGSQAVDGASFLVRYDPTQLAPVDGLGQAAQAVEPGLALPAVMGNWIDGKGGLIGFSSSMVQGAPPRGEFTVATLRFRLIGDAPSTTVGFDKTAVGAVQLTNGGTDLLSQVTGLTLTRQP